MNVVVQGKRLLHLAAMFVVCPMLLAPTGCGTDAPKAQAPCVGDDCGIHVDPDGGADVAVPGVDVGEDPEPDLPSSDLGRDAEPDSSVCDGIAPNACGGCEPLTAEPGDPCGECGDGRWICLGLNEVVCDGATAFFRDWWIDRDGDGFGDLASTPENGCEPPDEDYVPNSDDCNDDDGQIHPDAREQCNGSDDNCDGSVDEAPAGLPECADPCCDADLVCEDGTCLIRCDTVRCGEELDVCCEVDDICYANSCMTPGAACEFTEECEVDEICEPSLGVCLPRESVPACEYIPPVGEFSPVVGCRWTTAGLDVNTGRDDVVATPVVVNLTDDNDDGLTDRNDIPDVAFLTYNLESSGCCNVHATLRIVSGRCNDDGTPDTPATMTTLASINTPTLTNDTGMAAGDLDGDGVPEIVAVGFWGAGNNEPQGTVAFERLEPDGSAWQVMWQNESYPTWDVHTRGGAIISLADLDHDENPEVIVGNVVLNGQTGALIWDGLDSAEPGEEVGIGNNAFLGPASTVADVDGDTFLEVIAGNTLYSWDGDVIDTFDYGGVDNSDCGGQLPCDGFNGVGNFDDDDQAEIVIIRLGEVFVLEHDMTLKWRQPIPVDDCSRNEAGPPTVADFDGDGRPEIGTAGADYYVVVDMDCDPAEGEVPSECESRGILWTAPNYDCSSRATASSVFDFEGDGAAEVIYADERNFRIFDGATGAVLFDDPTHGSHTRVEMPVIADVDHDGNAEVIIPENGSNSGTPGLEVWEDADDNWVRTRRIWNQHGYHITNITEDGAIPQFEEPNWLNERFNNFRQNVQPAGLFDAPDLLVTEVDGESADCAFEIRVTAANEGALGVPEGVPIRIELIEAGEVVASLDTATTTRLLPGDEETIVATLDAPSGFSSLVLTVRATIDPDEEVNECDELDNVLTADVEFNCGPKD